MARWWLALSRRDTTRSAGEPRARLGGGERIVPRGGEFGAVHRLAGAIATMAAACGGIDELAFTGGIGEHATQVRERIIQRVRFLGDFGVSVVPAREEIVIARETERAVTKLEARESAP